MRRLNIPRFETINSREMFSLASYCSTGNINVINKVMTILIARKSKRAVKGYSRDA